MTDSIVCVSHTGEVRLPLFERLCDLDRIDFKGNPDIDTTTLVGWLTCNMETLNNLSELDASGIGVTGFIPRCLLLKQSNLRNVNLSSNRLTGPTVSEVIKLLSPCASSLERLNLSCNKLGGALQELGIKRRILIISACYAGVFVPKLASEDTAILTAAADNRTSFGCQAENDWTFFGDALINRALRKPQSITDASAEAHLSIVQWETKIGVLASLPQTLIGDGVKDWLPQLEARRPSTASAYSRGGAHGSAGATTAPGPMATMGGGPHAWCAPAAHARECGARRLAARGTDHSTPP